MAMWITKQRAQTGPVFGSVDKFEGLGIFFDTYKNNRPGTIFPYVMAMLGIIIPQYLGSYLTRNYILIFVHLPR